MKIKIDFTCWKLFSASYRGHEVYFALTNQKLIEPLFMFSSDINSDYKIVLMPEEKEAPNPTPEEFEKMEEYFWHEGYMEYLERWYNWLNNKNIRFTDELLEDLLGEKSHRLMRDWWKYDTLKGYKKNDSN